MAGHVETFVVTILNGGTTAEILPNIPTYAGIPASQANTPTANKKLMFGQAVEMSIYCPGTLPETVTLQTDPQESGQNWYTQTATLGAGLKVDIAMGAWKSARFLAGGAVAADRTFRVVFQYDMAT